MELYKNKDWLYDQHVTQSKSVQKIADEFGYCHTTIRYWKEKYCIKTPSSVRYSGVTKYTVNENYFDTIDTEEKAYWLGFIVADGSIIEEASNTKRLSVTLAGRDIHHLEALKVALGSNQPIETYTSSIEGYSSYEMAKLRINNTTLCDSLIAKGVLPKKSTREHYPEGIPEELRRHYWRGFIDGDGCITIYETKGKQKLQLSAIGSEEMIIAFHSFLSEHIQFRAKPLVEKSNWTITLSMSKASEAISLLYDDSILLLDRKKAKYLLGKSLYNQDIV